MNPIKLCAGAALKARLTVPRERAHGATGRHQAEREGVRHGHAAVYAHGHLPRAVEQRTCANRVNVPAGGATCKRGHHGWVGIRELAHARTVELRNEQVPAPVKRHAVGGVKGSGGARPVDVALTPTRNREH